MNLPNVDIKKILYATDLSQSAVHAFAFAASLAERYHATITILHVMTDFPGENYITNMIGTSTWEEIKTRHYSQARNTLIGKKREGTALRDVLQAFSDEVQSDAPDRNIVTDQVLIESGNPPEVIVQTAVENGCDLIVMGTHGQGVIADVLIGSTARWVVRQSPVPVLVVRLEE